MKDTRLTRSDPSPITQAFASFEGSPYMPGCLAGVELLSTAQRAGSRENSGSWVSALSATRELNTSSSSSTARHHLHQNDREFLDKHIIDHEPSKDPEGSGTLEFVALAPIAPSSPAGSKQRPGVAVHATHMPAAMPPAMPPAMPAPMPPVARPAAISTATSAGQWLAASSAMAAPAEVAEPEMGPGDATESSEEEGPVPGRKKPTRRGGRRARYRKHAALARRGLGEAYEPSEDASISNVNEAKAKAVEQAARQSKFTEQAVQRGGRPPKTYDIKKPGPVFSPAESMGSSASPASAPNVTMSTFGLLCSGEPAFAAAPEGLIGKQVLISGLVRMPQFNGRWGSVESYDAGMDRYIVNVGSEENRIVAKLKAENLLAPAAVQICAAPAACYSYEAAWPVGRDWTPGAVASPGCALAFQEGGGCPWESGTNADFEDSVAGPIMATYAQSNQQAQQALRLDPADFEDSGGMVFATPKLSPSRPGKVSQSSVYATAVAQYPRMSAADFEDSVAGSLLQSPTNFGNSSLSSGAERGLAGADEPEATDASVFSRSGGLGSWKPSLRMGPKSLEQ